MNGLHDNLSQGTRRISQEELTAIQRSNFESILRNPLIRTMMSQNGNSEVSQFNLKSFVGLGGDTFERNMNEFKGKFKTNPLDHQDSFKRIEKSKITNFEQLSLGKRDHVETSNTNLFFEKYNGNFESDSENIIYSNLEDEHEFIPIKFMLNQKECKRDSINKPILDFRNFVKKANTRFETNKIYECEICKQKFSKHAALGGHMSKIHPKTSKKFEERMNVYALRKSEREKRQFLNNL